MTQASYVRFQEAGKQALQEKRFQSAKIAFDQAIARALHDPKNGSNIVNTLLDLRVEAQLKLEHVDAALKDALTMIRHDRGDARGYLRCGQLCRLKYDYKAAQKWYNQGLKHTSKSNQHYASLELMSSKTTSRLRRAAESRFRDPFLVLPMDIIHMISEHLHLRQAITCLRVSKLWRDHLLAIPSIWKNLDLQGTRKEVTLTNVRACIRRLQNPPTTVRLDKLTDAAVSYLRPYIDRWKAIEHLSINLPDSFDLNYSWTLPIAIKSLHVGERCPVYTSVVDDIIHFHDSLNSARFDAILNGLPRREPSTNFKEHYRLEHRKATLPELSHLVLIAKATSGGFKTLVSKTLITLHSAADTGSLILFTTSRISPCCNVAASDFGARTQICPPYNACVTYGWKNRAWCPTSDFRAH